MTTNIGTSGDFTPEIRDNSEINTEPHVSHQQEGEPLSNCIRWIIWYLRRLGQAGELYSKELYKNCQISQPQLHCLLALYENGPSSLSKLAKIIMVKPSTITGIIDRLEQKGLAKRQRNRLDRRVITIELTQPGRELALKAPPLIKGSIVEGLKGLPLEEAEKIVQSLATLVSMLKDESL